MLRAAIASSNMPNGIAQKLQNDILRRGEKGGTALYFKKEESLKLSFMRSANHDFDHALSPVISDARSPKHKLRSQLIIHNIEDVTLSLQHNYLPIKLSDFSEASIKNQYPHHSSLKTPTKEGKLNFRLWSLRGWRFFTIY